MYLWVICNFAYWYMQWKIYKPFSASFKTYWAKLNNVILLDLQAAKRKGLKEEKQNLIEDWLKIYVFCLKARIIHDSTISNNIVNLYFISNKIEVRLRKAEK